MNSALLPILPAVYDILFDFAQSDDFWANLETAFGTGYDVVKATQLRQQWQSRDFSQLPPITVQNLGNSGIFGAYSSSTNRIYLSASFLNRAAPAAIVDVIVEEIGHFIDAQINSSDTPGDEGQLFSALVRGEVLTEEQIAAIREENDAATITVDGQAISVEMAFGTPTNFTVGSDPRSVTVGDFNGDGKSDLATANFNSSNNVSVLLGTGTGSFGTATNFTVGNGSNSVTVGDFNGDGKSDLTVANQPGNNVSVLLNADPTATVSITDVSQPAISLSINDVTVTEGNSGTTNAVFTVSLSSAVDTAITLDYATANGTATAGTDYTAIPTTTLTFNPGETSKTITVAVNGDNQVELNETFFLNLSNLQTNGSNVTLADNQGQGTINNDENFPTNLNLSNNTVAENSPLNTLIGNFTTTDPDTGNTFTYSLVTGIGSTDNSLFTIDGNQLKVNGLLDYETKNNYSIRVKTTDQGGLSSEKQLTVSVTNLREQGISVDKNAITFGTPLSQYRQGWSNSNLVRPKFADRFRYIDITNTGVNAEDILAISNIEVKASNVTTNANFSQGDILLNPGQTWRVQLTYAPTAARESFNLNDGLVIHSNAINNTAYNVALTGKSTFNSDITYNRKVDRGDLAPLQAAFNSSIGNPKYDPTADINGDSKINLGDFLVLNSDYGLSLI